MKPDFEPQEVDFPGYSAGHDRHRHQRALPLPRRKPLDRPPLRDRGRPRGPAVHRPGKVGDKQEWPRWIPTLEMQKREPKHYGQYKDGMDGGPDNPLGARAIYLYQGKHGHRIAHPRHQSRRSRSERRLEWLLPDDQRPRDRSLQPGEARHAGRHALIRLNPSAKRPARPAFLFWLAVTRLGGRTTHCA